MKISHLIYALEHMLREHGDLDVERMDFTGERVACPAPRLAHKAKLKGCEVKPRFAETFIYEDNYEAERKGEPVCRL